MSEHNWPQNYTQLSWKEILRLYDLENGESRELNRRGICRCEPCKWARNSLYGAYAYVYEPLEMEPEKRIMAGISVCDRCTSLVKGIAIGQISLGTSSDHSTRELINKELCPECVREILEFLEKEIPSREVRAFDKAYIRPKEKNGGLDDASAEELAKEFIKRMSENKKEIGS